MGVSRPKLERAFKRRAKRPMILIRTPRIPDSPWNRVCRINLICLSNESMSELRRERFNAFVEINDRDLSKITNSNVSAIFERSLSFLYRFA